MTTKVLWSLLMFGLAMSTSWSDQKLAQKQGPPAAATLSQVGLPFPHVYNISPEQKQRKNPVRFTDRSVDRGKRLFLDHCAMCHGSNGDGKGDLVKVFNLQPPDFTKSGVLDKRTDGELFAIIGEGSEKMPSHHTLLQEKQAWDVVNFLRLVEGKTPAKATEDEKGGTKTAAVPFPILD